MREIELRKIIASRKEGEQIEFKVAANDYSLLGGEKQDKRSLYGYCVGFGNSEGGRILFGLTDDGKIVGTHAFSDLEKVRAELYKKLGVRVKVDEVLTKDGRVVVVTMPGRRQGHLFNFFGRYLTRAGDQLHEMNQEEIAQILNETHVDFSALIIPRGKEYLDANAIKRMRLLYEQRHPGNESLRELTDTQFLTDIGLMKGGRINNTALLMLGSDTALVECLPNAEIIFEYRNNPHDIKYADRKNIRKALIFGLDELWQKIDARNFIIQLREGLVRRNIRAFNEDAIREAILNAAIHRDYEIPASVFVLQDSTKILFKNPGGFIFGITPENIYKKSAWRNRRLAETFEKIGLVERSGQGADLIFERSIKEGKGLPNYKDSTDTEVILILSAVVTDEEFISYLEEVNEKGISLSIEDLVVLEKIREGNAKEIHKDDVKKFLDTGIVVSSGVGRGTKYFLAKQYYKDHSRLGEYTRIKGLSRAGVKELILEHLRANTKVTKQECQQISPNLTQKDIANILQELRGENKIRFIGPRRSGHWILIVRK